MKIERPVGLPTMPAAARLHVLGRLCLATLLFAVAVVAQHPAFTVPGGFTATKSTDTERVFERSLPNGDVLRWAVKVDPSVADTTTLAKGMADADDKIREESKQDITIGGLKGVAWSCLGAAELLGGVARTRYRRVAGYTLSSAAPFGLRVDLLAGEARPAQSTLDANSSALAAWQKTLGASTTRRPPTPRVHVRPSGASGKKR